MPINNSLSLQLHSKGITGRTDRGFLESPPPPRSGFRAEPAGAS